MATEAGLDNFDDLEEVELYYYYDDENNFLPLRLRDMSGSGQELLKHYLMSLLNQMFKTKLCAVYGGLNFYETDDRHEEPLYPDVVLLKGQPWRFLDSYRLGIDGPAPDFIVEIVSDGTRVADLTEKPKRYEAWGAKEYFVYDQEPELQQGSPTPLSGWRLNAQGVFEQLESPEPDGRLWSEQVQCWLVPDEVYLRLLDRAGNLQLSVEEAALQRADQQELRAVQAQQRADQEAQRAIQAQRRADQAAQRAIQEQRRAERAEKKSDRLAKKLREAGIDFDDSDE